MRKMMIPKAMRKNPFVLASSVSRCSRRSDSSSSGDLVVALEDMVDALVSLAHCETNCKQENDPK